MKAKWLVLAAGAALAVQGCGGANPFPARYTPHEYRRHWYALTLEPGTWRDCEDEAVRLGGHLVTVNDRDEDNWLAHTFRDANTRGPSDNNIYWIGLRGRVGDQSAYWASGEPVGYLNPTWVRLHDSNYWYSHGSNHADPGWNSNPVHNDARRPGQHPNGVIELPSCPSGGSRAGTHGPSPARSPTTREFVFSYDFDTCSTDAPPVPPWQESYGRPGGGPTYSRERAASMGVRVRIVKSIRRGSSGKSCHFLDTSGGTHARLSHQFPRTKTGVLEYYMRTENENYEGVFVGLKGDFDDPGYCVAFGANGYIGVVDFWHGGWPERKLLRYKVGVWYRVIREFDFRRRKGRLYVEEVGRPANCAAHDIASGSDTPNSYVDKVVLFTSTSQRADCYIDGIHVTAGRKD